MRGGRRESRAALSDPRVSSDPGPDRPRGRARRKLVKERLSRRAVELFRERGYDNVTVDDIVAAEHASRSTFFRYFGTKDEAVVSMLDGFGAVWVERYRALLEEDPPWFALSRCALSSIRSHVDDPQLLDLMRLLWETPALRSRLAAKLEEWRVVFEAMTAEHLGLDETDLLPGLVTHSVIGAAEAATGVWVRTRGERDLLDLLDEALAMERRGWSSPNAAGAGNSEPGAQT
jgi:AcrR family transcriptional regulator